MNRRNFLTLLGLGSVVGTVIAEPIGLLRAALIVIGGGFGLCVLGFIVWRICDRLWGEKRPHKG